MDEFAIIKDDDMLIYVISDQIPHHSILDKSSTLLDFTVVSIFLKVYCNVLCFKMYIFWCFAVELLTLSVVCVMGPFWKIT
jgi:hypothetical protein